MLFRSDGAGAPLPIELISFEATPNGDDVDVSWATASEINNDYFEVLRSSNGNEFESIVTIDGAGNSNEILNYEFEDDNPYPGVSYYKLKQIDFEIGRASCRERV